MKKTILAFTAILISSTVGAKINGSDLIDVDESFDSNGTKTTTSGIGVSETSTSSSGIKINNKKHPAPKCKLLFRTEQVVIGQSCHQGRKRDYCRDKTIPVRMAYDVRCS
ncbi:hypothetical protein ACQKQC_05385 [Vibrio fortis]|uniref:hypothetical protein n=1 Tax=Vibrio fortis TaxID=212667 RepID=UPI0040688AC6